MSSKRYLNWLLCTTLAGLIAITFTGVKGMFFDRIFAYQFLYEHQVKKVEEFADVETVFVGDSSLGNSIDAKLFSKLSGQVTLNLGLTGLYGYAGSYNMIKRFQNARLKNVVLMHTLDMATREVSYKGYLLSSSTLSDFQELRLSEALPLSNAFASLVLFPGNLSKILARYLLPGKAALARNRVIRNDYIAQVAPIKADTHKSLNGRIRDDKRRFLVRIIEYCRTRGLKLHYVNGPMLITVGKSSTSFVEQVTAFVSLPGVNFIGPQVFIENAHIGDSVDHVLPAYKELYTKKYFDLIGSSLRR